jgi:hypothetical protein
MVACSALAVEGLSSQRSLERPLRDWLCDRA